MGTLAGVVAVDGGTVGLDVQFGAFLAVILGLFIPVVFLITLFIQSDAQGTATTFRQPDSLAAPASRTSKRAPPRWNDHAANTRGLSGAQQPEPYGVRRRRSSVSTCGSGRRHAWISRVL